MPLRETETLPDLPPVTKADAELIIALRRVGTEQEWLISADRQTFTLGAASSCDVVLAEPHVSNLHCTLERRGQRLRVIDQQSRNGTYFAGRRENSFDMGPGDLFTVANVSCLAMNQEMRAARDVLLELADFRASVNALAACDALLASAIRGSHVLLLGEEGCEQARLAYAIHQASPRRYSAFVEEPQVPSDRQAQHALLERARNGSLFLSLSSGGVPPDDSFRAMLVSPDFRVRVFVAAPTLGVAVNAMGFDAIARMPQILLSPLRDRLVELPGLLDRWLRRQGSPVCFGDLTPGNQRALRDHNWPRNLTELREAAVRLCAISTHGSLNRAAAAIGMPRSTLTHWASRLSLSLPLDGRGPGDSGRLAIPEALD